MNQTVAPGSRLRWLRTAIGSILVVLAVVGILAAIGYAKVWQIKSAMAAPPPPEMPISVTLAAAEESSFRRSSVVVGNVLAPESITLKTELAGTVTEIPMIPGGEVQRGEVLLRLDIRTEEAMLKSLEASRKLAESTVQRSRQLNRINAGSESELDIAEAELSRAEAGIEELRVRIDKKTLRAPFDARVGLFDLHVGQYLVEGNQVTTLEGIADYFFIDFSMPSHVADAIEIGDDVFLQIGADKLQATATIVAVDASANPISRSVTARARLSNPPPKLQPNDSVHVTVMYGQPIPVRQIPATAVRRGPSGSVVFVATETESGLRAQSRNVVVVPGGSAVARVIDGILAGESIVADGSFKVYEGALLADARSTAASNDESAASVQDAGVPAAVAADVAIQNREAGE
ncbi:efflux RND transporter periplasmic adaptor subunit [Rosistilla oblonga]|uniref:Toluene efflux pump periplasmic linker protein TtgG n=1 Tax=Rosistilla oblonga TaxID=2527990 RepID=A0A518ISA2_9BACT|nr:efflux RND transporter periplasmic adaptor subunit [Rosistilla oblonga]QDV55978.1 Toluene efflux pump periplasmic linker protein TtgG precursor [Rosistilla oblonga]